MTSGDINESSSESRQPTAWNPRLLPPIIALALLAIIALAILYFRGGQSLEPKFQGHVVVVRQVHQAPGSTYLEVARDDGEPFWLATGRIEVAVGDRVGYESAEEARNFPAPALNRTLERILLVGQLFKIDQRGQAVAIEPASVSHGREMIEKAHGGVLGHGGGHGGLGAASIPIPKLEKAEGGQTLAELSANISKFAGQTIKVRGVVVRAAPRTKVAADRPATNWYRLQDGSGAAEDLPFTADVILQRGDVVVITGKLSVDQDFGGDFRYKMIVLEAQVTRESKGKPADSSRSK